MIAAAVLYVLCALLVAACIWAIRRSTIALENALRREEARSRENRLFALVPPEKVIADGGRRRDVMHRVYAERVRQDARWGEQNHTWERWLAIIGEEFGESSKAIVERDDIAMVTELEQLAAVTINALECAHRRGLYQAREERTGESS